MANEEINKLKKHILEQRSEDCPLAQTLRTWGEKAQGIKKKFQKKNAKDTVHRARR